MEKMAQLESDIWFIKKCKVNNLIPNGFQTQNKLKNTIDDGQGEILVRKQAFQWMNLTLKLCYTKLSYVKIRLIHRRIV